MKVHRHADPLSFLERAGPFLMRAEVENNLILGICGGLGASPPAVGAQAPYFATVEADGQVAACAFRTPPHKAVITKAAPPALGALVEDLADQYPTLPAVLGPEPDIRQFAEQWSRRAGTTVRRGPEQRLFSIRRVEPRQRRPAGRFRAALEADIPLLSDWVIAFGNEAGGLGTSDPGRFTRERVEEGTLFVWEDAQPVSMAHSTGRTPTGVRISLVYTPPEHRRLGYASACVADLTQRLLGQGHAYCCLFTDLANPTSNRIYQAIGYRPVCDMTDYFLAEPEKP